MYHHPAAYIPTNDAGGANFIVPPRGGTEWFNTPDIKQRAQMTGRGVGMDGGGIYENDYETTSKRWTMEDNFGGDIRASMCQ